MPSYRSNRVDRVVLQVWPGASTAAAARWVHSWGQGVPGLDADEPHRLGAGAPDQGVGVVGHVADDAAAGVLLVDAQGLGAQTRHAVAVRGEQLIGQGDGLGVLPHIMALAVQKAGGVAVQDHGAFRLVEAELVVLGGVLVVKGDLEGRVVPDAEGQGLPGGGGVLHGQGVVDRFALQAEGADQHEVKGEALLLGLLGGLQPQLDRVPLGPDQGVLQIPGEAVLPALVGLALVDQGAAGELAGPGEQDRCVHGQGQIFVVDGCLHN